MTSDRPAPNTGEQLWEQGRVVVERGAHSLVLGVGRSHGALSDYADLADEAVPAVSDAWGTGWAQRVVVLVPKSLDGMGALLGAPAAGYRGIAAVTTGEAGAPGRTPADRIIVNPDAYGVLGAFGQQVVLTHETTHVATRAATVGRDPAVAVRGLRGLGRLPRYRPLRGAGRAGAGARGAARPAAAPRSPPTRTSGSPATLGGSRRRTRAAGWPAG